MKDKARTDIQVFETNDYSKFKRLEGNRDVKTYGKIVDSIQEIGYIPNPIIVNSDFEVVDGQNRLEALKKLEMPIQYYVVRDIGIEEARALNLGRSNWKPIDYVKSYAESGVASYRTLLGLLQKYKGMTLQELYGIIKNKIITCGWCVNELSKGHFTISQSEYASAVEKIELIYPIYDSFKQMIGQRRLIVTALAWCMNIPSCDKDRLVKTIKTKYPLFKPVVNVEVFLQDLTEFYNKGIKADKKIDFYIIHRSNNV